MDLASLIDTGSRICIFMDLASLIDTGQEYVSLWI